MEALIYRSLGISFCNPAGTVEPGLRQEREIPSLANGGGARVVPAPAGPGDETRRSMLVQHTSEGTRTAGFNTGLKTREQPVVDETAEPEEGEIKQGLNPADFTLLNSQKFQKDTSIDDYRAILAQEREKYSDNPKALEQIDGLDRESEYTHNFSALNRAYREGRGEDAKQLEEWLIRNYPHIHGASGSSPNQGDPELKSLGAARYVPDPADPDDFGLTPREQEVLGLIAAGHNNAEIAQLLGIALQTAKNHVTSMFGKTGTDNRLRLASFAARKRLIDLDSTLEHAESHRPPLTPRERQVLDLFAQGKSSEEIGRTLGIDTGTVHAHFTHILKALGVHDRAEAVTKAEEMGLLAGDESGKPEKPSARSGKMEKQVPQSEGKVDQRQIALDKLQGPVGRREILKGGCGCTLLALFIPLYSLARILYPKLSEEYEMMIDEDKLRGQIRDNLSHISGKYRIYVNTRPLTTDELSLEIKGEEVNLAEAAYASGWTREAFSAYPPDFVYNYCNLRQVKLSKGLKFKGRDQEALTLTDPQKGNVVYLNINKGLFDWIGGLAEDELVKVIMHLELYSLASHVDNPETKTTTKIKDTNEFQRILQDHSEVPPTKIEQFPISVLIHDRFLERELTEGNDAFCAAMLMKSPHDVAQVSGRDQELRGKIGAIMRSYDQWTSGKMGTRYWEDLFDGEVGEDYWRDDGK